MYIDSDDVALDRALDMDRSILRIGIRPHQYFAGQIGLRFDPPVVGVARLYVDDVSRLYM